LLDSLLQEVDLNRKSMQYYLLILFVNSIFHDLTSSRALPQEKLGDNQGVAVAVTDSRSENLFHAVIAENEAVKDNVEKDIVGFEELKARIYLIEMHLKQIMQYKSAEESGYVDETDKTLKEIDYKSIEPFEEKLLSLKTQISNHNLELEKDFGTLVNAGLEDAENSFQFSYEKLRILEEEVTKLWKEATNSEEAASLVNEELSLPHKDVTIDKDDGTSKDKKDSTNVEKDATIDGKYTVRFDPFAQFKIDTNMEKHIKDHEENMKLDDHEIRRSSTYFAFSHPYLVPGLSMLVFLMICSAMVCHLSRRRKSSASRIVSQAMARDLGYAELQEVGERKTWDSMGQFNGQHKLH